MLTPCLTQSMPLLLPNNATLQALLVRSHRRRALQQALVMCKRASLLLASLAETLVTANALFAQLTAWNEVSALCSSARGSYTLNWVSAMHLAAPPTTRICNSGVYQSKGLNFPKHSST